MGCLPLLALALPNHSVNPKPMNSSKIIALAEAREKVNKGKPACPEKRVTGRPAQELPLVGLAKLP